MVYVGDISTVNGIINQLITWGAPPCHFILFFIFPWIMCLRSMVHCTVVLCLMKPCVLVSFFRLDARLVVDDIAIGIDQFAYASVKFTENPDLKCIILQCQLFLQLSYWNLHVCKDSSLYVC